jgi:pimeloyl-ACP methyl ester carboxylesterase
VSPILFIHGLGASGRYFERIAEKIHDRTSFRPDLPGFGSALEHPGPYGIEGHLAFLQRITAALDEPPVVVGHSYGAVLAIAWGARSPAKAIFAINLPAFRSKEEARRRIRALGLMERWMADGSPWARAMCAFVCHLRPLARAMAPVFVPNLPKQIARDGVEHTWEAYRKTFDDLVDRSDVRGWIAAARAPIRIMEGDRDPICPPEVAREALVGLGVEVEVLPGDHHLPLRVPDRIAALVAEVS